MYRRFRRSDPALVFFALGALACLLVSIPATSAAMDLFHGKSWGIVATGVFEFGAVGLELMSLWIPQWRGRLLLSMIGMLIITTLFNYATGVDAFLSAQLLPSTTYAQIRKSDYGWLLAVAASALFPGMLGGFLLGLTARARMVRAGLHTPMAAVAFWVGAQWRAFGAELAQTGAQLAQSQSDAQQSGAELARVRQIAADLRMELAQRDAELLEVRQSAPQLTDGLLMIGARPVSLRQLSDALAMPESTLRRRVARLTGAEET